MRMLIQVRFPEPDHTHVVEAADTADAEAFFRVLAGPRGKVEWVRSQVQPGVRAVRVTDALGDATALAEVAYLDRVRPLRDNPQA